MSTNSQAIKDNVLSRRERSTDKNIATQRCDASQPATQEFTEKWERCYQPASHAYFGKNQHFSNAARPKKGPWKQSFNLIRLQAAIPRASVSYSSRRKQSVYSHEELLWVSLCGQSLTLRINWRCYCFPRLFLLGDGNIRTCLIII